MPDITLPVMFLAFLPVLTTEFIRRKIAVRQGSGNPVHRAEKEAFENELARRGENVEVNTCFGYNSKQKCHVGE